MAITLKPETKVLKAIQLLNCATEAEWMASNAPLMKGMLCYATDTRVIKIGDDVKTWSQLPVYFSPNVVAAAQTYKFVADIEARNNVTEQEKNYLIIVMDASADPTVSSGTRKQAGYVWNADASKWDKLFEEEAMDVSLANYFNMTENTADNINDGATKVMMTKDERTQLSTLVANAVKYTDMIVIQGVAPSEISNFYQP